MYKFLAKTVAIGIVLQVSIIIGHGVYGNDALFKKFEVKNVMAAPEMADDPAPTAVPVIDVMDPALGADRNADGLVSCSRGYHAWDPLSCGPCQLLATLQRVLNYMIYASVLFASIMFVYAGFLYLSVSRNPGNLSKGKEIFWNVLFGLVAVLAAWLVINLVLNTLAGRSLKDISQMLCSNDGRSTTLSREPGRGVPTDIGVPPEVTKAEADTIAAYQLVLNLCARDTKLKGDMGVSTDKECAQRLIAENELQVAKDFNDTANRYSCFRDYASDPTGYEECYARRSTYNNAPATGTPDPVTGIANSVPINSVLPVKEGACDGDCVLNSNLNDRLTRLAIVKPNGWIITETNAYKGHLDPCHQNLTCVDVNFRDTGGNAVNMPAPTEVVDLIKKGDQNNLYVVYEIKQPVTKAEIDWRRDVGIALDEARIPSNRLLIAGENNTINITENHASVYCKSPSNTKDATCS